MRDIIRKDILDVLDRALAIIESGEHHALGELSNHVIHDASIFQDEDSVSAAVLVYALGKVVQRYCEKSLPFSHIVPLVRQARDALKAGKDDDYRQQVRSLFARLRQMDEKLGLYITEVFEKARIKKASRMHEHGISVAQTAELLGISQWELQDYIGKTRIPDQPAGITAGQRLKIARSWF